MTAAAQRRREGRPREELRARLEALGFDVVRFAAVGAATGASLRDWLAAGYQADMDWMARSAEKRMDAAQVVSGARTVILLGVNYGGPASPPETSLANRPAWARYALHEDYHDTIKPGLVAAGKVLEELGAGADDYRFYTDTGPVMERGWAARAGLGFRGKNGMLISRRFGNWLFLASIVTRLEIEPDLPLRRNELPGGAEEEVAGLLCGKCTRCLEACPTDAFPRPGIVDARRCISYQTIENKGIIPAELRPGIGHRIYGCDVCLEVCPWNRFAQAARTTLLVARRELGEVPLRELLEMTPEKFAEVFRRTPIKRLKLRGLLRNACIVAGNSGDVSLVPQLVSLASHETALVRAHAVWAVRRLVGDARATELLAEAKAREADADVLAEHA